MSISAKTVMELRKITNVGMMDCKKALLESNGNIDVAKDILLKSGATKATKKLDRVAKEGLLFVVNTSNNLTYIILEVNCETDFVAKSDIFINFGNKLSQLALKNNCSEVSELLELTYDNNKTVEEERQTIIGQLGENIQVRRCINLHTDSGCVVSYSHGNKIATLVSISTDNVVVAKDIAMHIAAMRPTSITSAGIDESLIAKEREIYKAQIENSGKNETIMNKIIDGKISKYLNENSLYGQVFVKDSKKKISQYLKEHDINIDAFVFCEVGTENKHDIITK